MSGAQNQAHSRVELSGRDTSDRRYSWAEAAFEGTGARAKHRAMQKIRLLLMLGPSLVVAGCGSGSNNRTIGSGGTTPVTDAGGSSGSDGGVGSGGFAGRAGADGGGTDGAASCPLGVSRCASSSALQTCGTNGQWDIPWSCATGECSGGTCAGLTAAGASCLATGSGLTRCGGNAESCCTSFEVPGGVYDRTFTNDGTGATNLGDSATVSGFRLDKYLVTVGRFRRFVAAWNGGAGYSPRAGSGKHAHLNGGSGLNATAGGGEPGWVTSDNDNIAPTDNNLACDPAATWTSPVSTQEDLPINCVTWYEAYAFCIWDGGFLPSEAEWEYAAAGGDEEREYPWGSTGPGTANQYAIYGDAIASYYSSGAGGLEIAPVGSATLGAGRWGQLDLAGEVWEWNVDWFDTFGACTDCADFTPLLYRVIRGGEFLYDASYLLTVYRSGDAPSFRANDVGFRCARVP